MKNVRGKYIGAISIFILSVIILVFIILNFWLQCLSYEDLNITIKFFTGIGTILTAWGVYWKWNDEKVRKLYERRMQDVYAPLYSIIIRQEVYRFLMKGKINDIEKIDIYPLISVTQSQQNTHITQKGVSVEKKEIDGREYLPNEKYLLDIISKANRGLLAPELLIAVEMDKTILNEMENPMNKEIDLGKLHVHIQLDILNRIVDGYNDCIKNIGLDNMKVSLEDIRNKLDYQSINK